MFNHFLCSWTSRIFQKKTTYHLTRKARFYNILVTTEKKKKRKEKAIYWVEGKVGQQYFTLAGRSVQLSISAAGPIGKPGIILSSLLRPPACLLSALKTCASWSTEAGFLAFWPRQRSPNIVLPFRSFPRSHEVSTLTLHIPHFTLRSTGCSCQTRYCVHTWRCSCTADIVNWNLSLIVINFKAICRLRKSVGILDPACCEATLISGWTAAWSGQIREEYKILIQVEEIQVWI